ncbi:MAG: hypothetical protein HC809_10025 [Gammaproteobacteria bacterium]|nr:hypothetical protein [Gammaproteobacteria bacterium]
MRSLFIVFVNIILLRRGPELVPTQPWFVGAVAIINFMASFVVSNHVGAALTTAALATSLLVTMATLSVVVFAALYLRGFDRRFPATITAMFGCDLIFTVMVGVLMLLVGGVATSMGTTLLALIGLWSIAVNGFILHRAMEVSVAIGILLAFATAMFGFMLSSLAMGPITAPQ